MYTKEQLLHIYGAAYFNETGFRLTNQSLDRITFDSYTSTYVSSRNAMHISIVDFDDNDTFEKPITINLWNINSEGWKM